MSLRLVAIATVLSAVSGLPGLLIHRRSFWSQWIAAGLMICGAVLGLVGAGMGLLSPAADSSGVLPWPLMGGGLTTAVDAVGAFFLVPVFTIGGLGAIYGLGYWRQAEHAQNGRKLSLFWGFLVAGMALVVLARHAMLFLLGWEAMALSAFFLITVEDDADEVRRAGWIYLIATHVGTLCLLAMFGLLHRAAGSFDLGPVTIHQAGPALCTAVFILALVGFGLKAGIMPLHFWLPSAHANAPSHVSALLSGVMIKMGIYGLVRICGWLPEPPVFWGALLLILGVVSGLLGVALAIGQHDLKRLLAYHSVENIGIIVMGLGLAMIGRSLHQTAWVLLGLAGCLLHVWNHGLFKSLLFFSAGSVIHATGTRRIDRLGGLAPAMPWTSALFLVGAVAICGLPPLNGFVSEILIYQGLFLTIGPGGAPALAGAAMAVPALAMIGALAVACFVKVYGIVFLGMPRSEAATHPHESPAGMILPMGLLAACCAAIGLFPWTVAPVLDRAVLAWGCGTDFVGEGLASVAPLVSIGILGMVLVATVGIATVVLFRYCRFWESNRVGTWDCGYVQPTARMQYTASSFAGMIVDLFGWVLRPRVHPPRIQGAFPPSSDFESHVHDPILDEAILPAGRAAEHGLTWFRKFQQGFAQNYILYILLAVVVILAWTLSFY